MGTRYYYQITNPSVPGLTLTSRMRRLVAYDGWEVKTCLAYDQANPTLLKLTSVPSLSQAVALCLSNAALEDSILTELAIQKLVEIRASAAYNSYRDQCLWGLGEKLQYRYASREHHYTLYYYDQAGNLVQSVPPAGVQPLSEAQVAAFMAGNRTDPPHTLKSQYQYNSLNALIAQKTPDGGESRFYYNEKGQMRLSQNGEQSKVKQGKQAYSYTRYDEQGRTTEVGELTTAQAQTTLQDSLASSTFPLTGRGDYQLSDRTLTFYDFARPGFQGTFAQQFLRSRVSWSAVLEKGRTDTLATYYRYDVHGNVRSLLQAVPGLSRKRTDYRYDLVSGKVNYVFYQYGKADELTHRYQYDADNRLTGVYTSSDGFLWNKEAKYQYYLHGPLARMELGEYRVQGQDYYYTLQGWIKGVNRPFAGDPGKDGMNGSTVGKDAFAYTLGYYDGDYQPINASLNYADNRDQLWSRLQQAMNHRGLYNGNISWMVTDLPKLGQLANNRAKGMQGMLYGYDQLNRIVQSRSLTNYQANTGFAARASTSTAAYDEDYSYDGNGNLLSLQRRNETGALQDDFNYQYYAGSNKLREVKPVSQDKTIRSGSVKQDNIRYRNLTLTGSSYVSAGRLVEVKALEKIQLSPQFRSAQGTDFWAHLVDDGTFQYDGIGNLILDQDEGVKISWTPYGKIREVSVKGDSLVTRFRYDAMGNRVEKRVLLADTTYALTRYIRDASGNVMAIYKDTTLTEQPLYGSSRLGEYRGGVGVGMRKLGRRHYELSNHLGNVLAVVSDQVGMQTDSVWATVASTSDYYPFGLTMKGRTWGDTTGYKPRYGFGGHEKDDEIKGPGNHLSFGDYGYDPRLGRRWNVDPMAHKMPAWSSYSYCFNNPISFIDPNGQIPYPITIRSFAPFTSFGFGFHGDGRGYSNIPSHASGQGPTARAHQRILFDTDKTSISAYGWSSPTYRSDPSDSKTAKPSITFNGELSITTAGDVKSFKFGTHSAAANPKTPPGTPNIDVFSSFSITENKKSGTLSVSGKLTGDNFPSTEAFISDPSGQDLFISVGQIGANVGKNTGPFTELPGENKDNPITNFNFTITTDKKGNFTGVQAGGKTYSITDWNKKFLNTKPQEEKK